MVSDQAPIRPNSGRAIARFAVIFMLQRYTYGNKLTT
jgi:hypothetical protein